MHLRLFGRENGQIVSSSLTRYNVVGLKCMQMLGEFSIANCASVKGSSVSACNGTQISVCVIRLKPLGDDGFKSPNIQISLQIEQVYNGPFFTIIPTGTQCCLNIGSTLIQRHDVESMLSQCCVSAGISPNNQLLIHLNILLVARDKR